MKRGSRGMNILIVDDDRSIREMLIESLADEGYAAQGAADGVEALRYLQSAARPPCAILLDLMMPRMDGWQFLRAQRELPAAAAIPVIILTARPDGREQAAELMVAAYLPKPVDFDALLGTVRRFCASGARPAPPPL
jgi:DNA-binding response OmpR family regulator